MKGSPTRPAWLVVFALAGVGGGAYALKRARPAASFSSGASASSSEAARRFRLGEQRRWALSFEARLAERRSGATAPVGMTLTGQWLVTVVSARADDYDVACEISDPKATGAGVEAVRSDEVTALERRMARRFFVTYRADGAALRVYFPKDVDPGTRNLLQTIATDTQLVRPAQPAPRWTAMERDGAGGYLAAYQETAPGQLTKTKLKYLDADGTAGAAHEGKTPGVDVLIDASTRHLTVDPTGALVAFEGGDTTRIDLPMGNGGISMRVSVHLADLRVSRADDLVGALDKERAALDGSPIVTHAPSEEETRLRQDRELVAGVTFEDLLHDVRDPAADERARTRLPAWLRLHPESVEPTADATRAATPGVLTKVLTQALGQAGSPPAQAALCALARDAALRPDARSDALVGLMIPKKPTAETIHEVRGLLDVTEPIVRKAARFLAGTLARTLRPDAPAEADALDALLLEREGAARNDAKMRVELLAAMGNSAGPSLLPPLRAAMSDVDPAVRATATRSLRLYESDATEALVGHAILHDRDGGVRAAAVFTAGFGDAIEPYVDALTAAALHDTAEYVRSSAVTQLGRHLEAGPTVPTTLAQVAANDPKPGIRRLARAALDKAAR